MHTDCVVKPEETPTLTPDRISALLIAAEYLMYQIEKTPKEYILDIGYSDADGDVIEMPLVDSQRFKALARIIKDCRYLWDKNTSS